MIRGKKSVLMMPTACGLGDAMRCVCLGKGLQKKDHKIAFTGREKILDLIRQIILNNYMKQKIKVGEQP